MPQKPHKRPAFGAPVQALKIPVVTEGSFNDRHPSWRIEKLQLVDPYGWHELTGPQVKYLHAKLAEYERKDWNQILVTEKKWNHAVPVDGFKCPKARQWMRRNMPDQEELWSLRLSGAERVWGVYREGIFHLIWWDPQHLVWDTPKK